MMDTVGRFMAGLLSGAIYFLIFAVATWLGMKTVHLLPGRRSERTEIGMGCGAMLLWFAVVGFLLAPSAEVLKSYSCGKARDYDFCMDPPE